MVYDYDLATVSSFICLITMKFSRVKTTIRDLSQYQTDTSITSVYDVDRKPEIVASNKFFLALLTDILF